MTNNPYEDIAKEFIELWQKQIRSVVTDKQFMSSMFEFFQKFQGTSDAKPNNTTSSDPSYASDAEHGVLAELAFRVAMCEKRLAALEASGKREGRRSGGNSKQTAKTRATGSKKPNG